VSALWSISSTFYAQLLRGKIPKGQKDTDGLTEFLRFWVSVCVKALRKHVDEIDTWMVKYSASLPSDNDDGTATNRGMFVSTGLGI